MADESQKPESDATLLIVDDDRPFLTRLGRAMETRGFTVALADTVTGGIALIKEAPPSYAVIDLRLGDGNGLDVISALHERRPDARAIVLTGYGNISNAVTAVKIGAVDYLSKPADADEVYAALMATDGGHPPPPDNPMSADRCARNISSGSMNCATAMCRKPRAASTCTAAPCSAFWQNARRVRSGPLEIIAIDCGNHDRASGSSSA